MTKGTKGNQFQGSRLAALITGGAVLALLWLVGCTAVGPDYHPPEVPVPDRWHSESADAHPRDAGLLAGWWQALDDPVLTRLIHQAASDNLDVRGALSRLREARAQRLRSRASLFPTADASASGRKSGRRAHTGETTESDLYSAAFDAGWELDLFGGVRRSVEASRADLDAAVADVDNVMVAMLAEVAVNYIDLRTGQARLSLAERNISTLEETWQLTTALNRSGVGDALAVDQARYNLESARARIPGLKTGVENALNRLAVLTGQAPGALHDALGETHPLSIAPDTLAIGVPADTIRQRPDVRKAERELAAQTARIGVAESERYPKLTLSGSIGVEALSLGDLFSSPDRVWSLGPSISWRLFDAGAVSSEIKVQEALQEQAMIRYKQAILTALEEVENALTSYVQERQHNAHLQSAAAAARSAAELATQQYTTGMTGFSDVLDAQRSLISFEDQVAESRGAVLTDLVRLYKALGGGWQSFTPTRTEPPAPTESDRS